MGANPPGDPADWEFDEELEEQWLAEWAEFDREAVDVLRGALSHCRGQLPPATELQAAAAAVRAHPGGAGGPLDWVWQAAGAEVSSADDAELLVGLTAATISPQEMTDLDADAQSLIGSLEHADWLGAIVTAVRGGPGADASPSALVNGVRDCPEIESGADLDIDDESLLGAAFSVVGLPWEAMGLTNSDERLTELGAWVLPRALARAWNGDFDADSPSAQD